MSQPQVANAKPGLFPLVPVSELPAEQVRANFDALLPGKDIPLIWERTYSDGEE